MLSHRHLLKPSAKESSTVSNQHVQLGSGATVSVEQANEIVAKLHELERSKIS